MTLPHPVKRVLMKAGWAHDVARSLTDSPADAWRVYAAFWSILFTENRPQRRALRLTWKGRRFNYHIGGLGDMGTLVEVFISGEYAPAHVPPKGTVLDLGANTGAAAVCFGIRFPGATIHCYEPDPDNHALLLQNTCAFPSVTVWNAAVWIEDGTVTFHADPVSGNSSSVSRRRDRQQAIPVEAVSLPTALSRLPGGQADLVKYDVEGAEYELFQSVQAFAGIWTMIGEHHHDLGPEPALMATLSAVFVCDSRPLSHARSLVHSRRRSHDL